MGAVTLNSKTSSSSNALDFTMDLSLPAELNDLNGDASVDFQRAVDQHSHEVDMNLQAGWLGGEGVEMDSPPTQERFAPVDRCPRCSINCKYPGPRDSTRFQ